MTPNPIHICVEGRISDQVDRMDLARRILAAAGPGFTRVYIDGEEGEINILANETDDQQDWCRPLPEGPWSQSRPQPIDQLAGPVHELANGVKIHGARRADETLAGT